MDSHALDVLEFPLFLESVAEFVQTQPGRKFILDLRPTDNLEEILSRRAPFMDATALVADGTPLPGVHFEDLRDVVRRLSPEGAVVGGDELVACRSLLDSTQDTKTFLASDVCRERKHLWNLGERLEAAPEIRSLLHRSLDADGEVLDQASPLLAELRRRAVNLERRLQRSLDALLRSPASDGVVRDKFVTTRNGRFVIPVRRGGQTALPGVVHDHSNSGQTVFIEPTATLPLGNELADTRLEERDEVRRILRDLSARVRTILPAITINSKLLAQLDAAFAVGRWASREQALFPRFGSSLDLKQARHPLLAQQLRREGRPQDLVPLRLALDKKTRCLAITGSNTGGKTVALKTVGLLSLAAQTALPVPVGEDSQMELFHEVFADIGDEQSLENSLSTFSGHLAQITRILRSIGDYRTLVLLDELGSGTDPLEGGALACAVLEALARTDSLTFATTHLGVVKNFVQEHDAMINAAVRFNTDTLCPEYELEIGRPGASHALLIAQRLKLPKRVLQRAEKLLSTDHLRLETMLAKMEEDQRRIAEAKQQASAERKNMLRDRDSLKVELENLRKERRELMNEAYRQANGIVENTRRQMENQIREIRETATQGTRSKEIEARVRQNLKKKGETLNAAVRQTATPNENPVEPAKLAVGDRVWITKLGEHGEIAAFTAGGRKAEVLVGGLRTSVAVGDLSTPRSKAKAEEKNVKVNRPRSSGTKVHELLLIGMRVDEAEDRLRNFLADAMLANVGQVRIVHGFGTGRLRNGIHDFLKRQRCVKSFRLGRHEEDPGGAGVTLVNL